MTVNFTWDDFEAGDVPEDDETMYRLIGDGETLKCDAVIYTRVSTEEQGKGFSIQTQLEECRDVLRTPRVYTIAQRVLRPVHRHDAR